MKNFIFFLLTFTATSSLLAFDSYQYKVDLSNVENDKVNISLTIHDWNLEVARFNFPKTIPGTYATEDYGRFIENVVALDKSGKSLIVTKEGNNTFVISSAKDLQTISYKVNDSFDAEVKENEIFSPAGTNIEKGKNFVINNGGFFGYFDGLEKKPYQISFQKPKDLWGITVLNQIANSGQEQSFEAKDYHHLVDCPILFAQPDTLSFRVNNALVSIGVYSESGHKMAGNMYKELKPCMDAVAKFLPKLPVENYAFLFYVADFREVGELLKKPTSPSSMLKIAKAFKGKGVGALEHGNSSFYYLLEADVPGLNYDEMVKDVAIHEFMHIITPLGLHSQHISNFNYTKPTMCQHLWLYEGITEYFADLIQLQGDITNLNSYWNSKMAQKIKAGEEFPLDKMSMTQMSAHVLEKPYLKEYNHVYDRGAVLGLLLDIEIIRLTKGEKTLKDIVLKLRDKYGSDKAFEESTFIKEFVDEVHPELEVFFDNYVTGQKPWDITKSLNEIGIEYAKDKTIKAPKDPMKDNDIKMRSSVINTIQNVKKVGKKEWAGIQVNDQVVHKAYSKSFKNMDGTYKTFGEGEKVKYEILRNNRPTEIEIPVIYADKKIPHYFMPVASPIYEQTLFRNVWLGKKEGKQE